MKKIILSLLILAVPMIVTAQKIEDVKPGMTKEAALEIAGKPLNIIISAIDKSTASSFFSY